MIELFSYIEQRCAGASAQYLRGWRRRYVASKVAMFLRRTRCARGCELHHEAMRVQIHCVALQPRGDAPLRRNAHLTRNPSSARLIPPRRRSPLSALLQYVRSPHRANCICTMASSVRATKRRIMADVRELSIDPSDQYAATPRENDMFEWDFSIRGPAGTPFEGGVYHGRIILPTEYPFKPPHIMLLTQNGRWAINKKICLSISAFHPEDWQPAWGVRTILEAIIAFMPTEGNGAIGAVDFAPEERKRLARLSHSYAHPNMPEIPPLRRTCGEGGGGGGTGGGTGGGGGAAADDDGASSTRWAAEARQMQIGAVQKADAAAKEPSTSGPHAAGAASVAIPMGSTSTASVLTNGSPAAMGSAVAEPRALAAASGGASSGASSGAPTRPAVSVSAQRPHGAPSPQLLAASESAAPTPANSTPQALRRRDRLDAASALAQGSATATTPAEGPSTAAGEFV